MRKGDSRLKSLFGNGYKKNGKRSFSEIRQSILKCLASGEHTINQISFKTRINWRTVELHLTYLVGRGLVRSVFSSEYVKIFELTEKGEDYVRLLKFNEEKIIKI
jgi:predicted transcriptional regulator